MTSRDIVHNALADSKGFVSAQMLHACLLVAGNRIGLNTVYRVLRELVHKGRVDVIQDPAGGALYRLRAGPHHSHYLFCRTCGYSVPLESEAIELWAASVGDTHAFVNVEHTIELVGVCAACAESKPR